MRHRDVIAGIGIVLLMSTYAFAQETKAGLGVGADGTVDQEEYRIGPEDALQIFVWKTIF